MIKLFNLPKNFCIFLITFYQKTLSPDHGFFSCFFPYGYCRFSPSCSQYTKQAIEKHGCLKGIIIGFWRILRCNPWGKGGVEEVR